MALMSWVTLRASVVLVARRVVCRPGVLLDGQADEMTGGSRWAGGRARADRGACAARAPGPWRREVEMARNHDVDDTRPGTFKKEEKEDGSRTIHRAVVGVG